MNRNEDLHFNMMDRNLIKMQIFISIMNTIDMTFDFNQIEVENVINTHSQGHRLGYFLWWFKSDNLNTFP